MIDVDILYKIVYGFSNIILTGKTDRMVSEILHVITFTFSTLSKSKNVTCVFCFAAYVFLSILPENTRHAMCM